MSALSKRERVEAALHRAEVDRVPVSAWRHFIPAEQKPDSLADISLKHFYEFDWDWIKVNPRATYYAEAWGNTYDYSQYARVYPRRIDGPLHTPSDLEKIQSVSGTSGVFAEQLELIRRIRAGIGGAHFVQTLFSPLSVLSFLVAHPLQHTAQAVVQAQYDGLRRYLDENPQGVHAALRQITLTLTEYAGAVIEAGASGLFFAIVKLARPAVLTEAEFAEFGRPYDLQLLQAVKSAPFNLLHICGDHVYFEAVQDYPVQAINWASVGQANPGVAEARQRSRLALIGGIDEDGVLQTGTPAQVLAAAQEAIHSSAGTGFLLSPGCGTSMEVPPANLHALRQAAEKFRP